MSLRCFLGRISIGFLENGLQIVLNLPDCFVDFSEWSVRVDVREFVRGHRVAMQQKDAGNLAIRESTYQIT